MPRLACRTTTLARAAWVSGWPSSPKPPSTSSGPPSEPSGRPSTERIRAGCSGPSVITTSALRTGRRRARSAGRGHPDRSRRTTPTPSPGEEEVWMDWARVMPLAFRSRSPAAHAVCPSAVPPPRRASRSRGGYRRRRRRLGRRWRTSGPPASRRVRALRPAPRALRRPPPRPPRPALPTGAEQPPSSVASTARSAVTAARVPGVVQDGDLGREVVRRAALDRERTLPGSGEHLQRVEHLGGLLETADPGQSGAGEHARRRTRPSRTLRIRVSTLPRMSDDLQTEAERVELGRATRRAGADAAAGRQLAERQPVAGDHDVARVLAQRYGGQREAVGRPGGEVLERVDGHVDRARRAVRRAGR